MNKNLLKIAFLTLVLFTFGCTNKNIQAEESINSKEVNNEVEESSVTLTEEKNNINNESNIVETDILENVGTEQEETEEETTTIIKEYEGNLQDLYNANTISNILNNYLSVQFYHYYFNKDGAKTAYFEGYEDKQHNRAIRKKSPTENNNYSYENLPYYVRNDNGKYEEVLGSDTSPLPKTHYLNSDNNKNLDIFELDFGSKYVVENDVNVVTVEKDGDNIVMMVEKPFTNEVENNTAAYQYYKDVLNIDNIDTFLIEYTYNNKNYILTQITEIAICADGNSYTTSNIVFNYDINVLTAIKTVNEERGQVVYFDTKSLEKNNTYNKLKKDIISMVITDVKYDKKGNITHDLFIYTDEDGYILVKDVKVAEKNEDINNPIYHVRYERKWYDYINGQIIPSTLTDEEKNMYSSDPIYLATNRKSLIDSQEKVVTSYEEKGNGIIIQEQTELSEDNLYKASVLPKIDNVTKIRREVFYDMDEDIIKNYVLKAYDINRDEYVVEKCEVLLDQNEPAILNKVIDYIEDME